MSHPLHEVRLSHQNDSAPTIWFYEQWGAKGKNV